MKKLLNNTKVLIGLMWFTIVYTVTLFAVATLELSCNVQIQPEFYRNGKPCYTQSRCVKSHMITKWEYHYGYNFSTSKWEYHFGTNESRICDSSVTDTIEINN